jgi:hypothetical protein
VDVELSIIITNAETQEMQIHLFLHHALVKVPPRRRWSFSSFNLDAPAGSPLNSVEEQVRSDLCSSTSNQPLACFSQQYQHAILDAH